MFKFIEQPTAIGSNESKAILDVIPIGPYFLIQQGREDDFEKNFLTWELLPKAEFIVKYGYFTYAMGWDGMPIRVAYWLDTSG